MQSQLFCPNDTRRALVRDHGAVNGIDYLEVLDNAAPPGTARQRTLIVHCFQPVAGLTAKNVRIEGGERIRSIQAVWAFPADAVPSGTMEPGEQSGLEAFLAALPDRDHALVVRTNSEGDFSTYTLRLTRSSTDPDEPDGFDPMLASVDFSFKVDCPNDFDCQTPTACPDIPLPLPQIDYLAKDYTSFRTLMLDRMAVTMPEWQERNPADLGIALVEIIANAADHLSYYQDAVATEAYLGTARRRTSLRRHTRLLDYFLHDGVNARVWVSLEVEAGGDADGATLPQGTAILTRDPGQSQSLLAPDDLAPALRQAPIVFETLHYITLQEKRNRIPLYTWGDPHCCLPQGATHAFLEGSLVELDLQRGDVLILEEVLGPTTGREVDADPTHRHPVRLNTMPVEHVDLVNSKMVLEVQWGSEDALPFPLCLSEFDGEGGVRQHAVVALGNVVLADHGLTVAEETPVPAQVPPQGKYRPYLQRTGLTQRVPYDHDAAKMQSAAAAQRQEPRQALPSVLLEGDGLTWQPQRDLLNSDRFAPEFVVEMESDGRAYLRFGDGVIGLQPAAEALFRATYRVGNGRAGNIGAEALVRIVTTLQGIRRVRNPLPAIGGTEPEPLEAARLYAPQAFRSQERAVTETDYAEIAQRHPEVQRAAATRRWTGSWHTMFLTIDRLGGRPVDADFEATIRDFLDGYRMAGVDVEIAPPHYVSLEIVLTICVTDGHFRSDVRQALLETFSNRDLSNGRRGFFHPDNFTFGQPVYLSQIIAAAMQVPGVAYLDVSEGPGSPNRFQRWGQPAQGEIAAGQITIASLEVARLDNDPSAPENGKLDFVMKGGL